MKKLAVLVFFSLMTAQTHAVDGISFEYGHGNMVKMARVGILWNWDRSWLNDGAWHVTGFWELMLGDWRGYKHADNNQTITDVGLTPVFRLEQKEFSGIAPYLEGAVGVHLISPTFVYSNRKFGSAFQFGDHLGFGLRLGDHHQFDLGYRYQHMSNGDTQQPNQGINFNQVHFIYHF